MSKDEAKWQSLYAQVESSPDDFDAWLDLVDASLTLDGGINRHSNPHTVQLCRFSFDGLLGRFPMLQGYWKKYADLEFKLDNINKAMEVYEKGVSIMPGCIDLWVDYCAFKTLVTTTEAGVLEIRELLERAVDKVGNHFLSHELWDLYIEFEERDGNSRSVFELLERIIEIPLHQYAKYYDRFRKLAKQLPLESQVSKFYLDQFQAEYELEQENVSDNTGAEGLANADLTLRITNYHNSIYSRVQGETTRRFAFESVITRPYFHIAYLPEEQLQAWRKYLTFEEIEGDIDRICLLYERALIPTCLGEEFWLRYARWLLSKGMLEHAREVLLRGCSIVPIGRIALRHLYAKLLLSQGEIEGAKMIYTKVLEALPNSVETATLLLSLVHSQSGIDAVLAQSQQLLESKQLTSDDRLALIVDLAYFYTSCNYPQRARELFEKYKSEYSAHFYFWKKYLLFEIDQPVHSLEERMKKLEDVQTLFNLSKTNSLDPTLVKELARSYSTFLLEYGGKSGASEFLVVDNQMNQTVR
jgi:pre-mRNA-processing factor 39